MKPLLQPSGCGLTHQSQHNRAWSGGVSIPDHAPFLPRPGRHVVVVAQSPVGSGGVGGAGGGRGGVSPAGGLLGLRAGQPAPPTAGLTTPTRPGHTLRHATPTRSRPAPRDTPLYHGTRPFYHGTRPPQMMTSFCPRPPFPYWTFHLLFFFLTPPPSSQHGPAPLIPHASSPAHSLYISPAHLYRAIYWKATPTRKGAWPRM